MKYSKCVSNNPDCNNCPFPDCVATLQDINRQESWKKRREGEKLRKELYIKLVDARKSGMKYKQIKERYNVSYSTIKKALKADNL